MEGEEGRRVALILIRIKGAFVGNWLDLTILRHASQYRLRVMLSPFLSNITVYVCVRINNE